MKKIKCPCQSIPITNTPSKFEDFASLRESCPALREVLFPETIWHDYQKMVKANNHQSRQLPIVLGAFNRGLLARITMPVHAYLLDGQTLNVNLTKQYKKDLNEKWILERDQLAAYKKLRIFKGKLTEIMVAAWLEDSGWKINNLEALGGSFDIEATSPEHVCYGIEVKYIGIQDYRYNELQHSLRSGEAVSGFFNIYNGYNFILFKIFEAAKQLTKCKNSRLSLVVVDSVDWDFLEMPIRDKWINSRPIRFSDSADRDWKEFLEQKKKEKRFVTVENELDKAIGGLKECWILKETYMAFVLEERIELYQNN